MVVDGGCAGLTENERETGAGFFLERERDRKTRENAGKGRKRLTHGSATFFSTSPWILTLISHEKSLLCSLDSLCFFT